MKLTGNRCQCSGCGKYFNSVAAFDLHRRGLGVSRHCDTSGMPTNKEGYFVTALKDADGQYPINRIKQRIGK